MRAIAERIDYTATALYKHFADKEALLHALCDTDFLTLRRSFERIGRVADPIERLRKLGRAYVEFALAYPNHYRLMFMTSYTKPDPSMIRIEQGNPDQDAYAFLKATVAEGLAAGRFRSEYDDADLISQIVWSGVHGLVALHLIKGSDPWLDWKPAKKTGVIFVDVMIRGLSREG